MDDRAEETDGPLWTIVPKNVHSFSFFDANGVKGSCEGEGLSVVLIPGPGVLF